MQKIAMLNMGYVFHKISFSLLFIIYFINMIIICLGSANNLSNHKVSSKYITAVFVFGDSTVDPGNNNHIKTVFRSDFSPYGVDYPNRTPTGRFCNGRLATDFIAIYAGVKQSIPAYLDPSLTLKDLTTGVSFASAGAGYDPITSARNNVMDMPTQLEYLDEYMERIQSRIGNMGLKKIMKHSVFIISCGTNDIIYTYGIVDSPILSYTVPTYLQFLLQQSKWLIQALIDRGAERIAIAGLPPVGCLPVMITLHSPPHKPRKCVESLSTIAKDYNQMLQLQLKTIQASQPNVTILYVDIYAPIEDQINHPTKYGFEVVNKGCCGTGLLEAAFICDSFTQICNDRSKYVFWDSIHPSEKSYNLVFESIRPTADLLLHN